MMSRPLLVLVALAALFWGVVKIALIFERSQLRQAETSESIQSTQRAAIEETEKLIIDIAVQVTAVQQKKSVIAKAAGHQRKALEKVAHENPAIAAWADQPLPNDVVRLLDRTAEADTTLDGYLERLRASEPVPPAISQSENERRPAEPVAGDSRGLGDLCGGSGNSCPLPAETRP